MERYENLGMIGEGSYGMVMKCRHKESRQLVAIKKFLETEEDKMVKKIALREVRMLKQLRHENLVNLIEVFRRKKRLYLVFEFVDHTALDDLEKYPMGADENFVKKIMWQVIKGVEFCHSRNVIHRDVKPENILVSKRGVVKLCDFGFARAVAPPGEAYTDYVATRWYRAPELLVGDTSYGKTIDVWAIGSLFSEMLTGEPLFPGESDIDQLYLITKCFGNLIARHREIFSRNPLFIGIRLPEARELEPLERRYPQLSQAAMDMIKWTLRLDPNDRPTCSQLLRHEIFTKGGWSDRFTAELRSKIEKELEENPLLKNLGITIYGSVYEAQLRASSDKISAQQHTHAHPHAGHMRKMGESTGAGEATGDDVAAKKKKKKKQKDPLLHHREKAHPEKLKRSVKESVVVPHTPPRGLSLPLTGSRVSLTGSRSHLPSPRQSQPQGPPVSQKVTGFGMNITAPPPSTRVPPPLAPHHTHPQIATLSSRPPSQGHTPRSLSRQNSNKAIPSPQQADSPSQYFQRQLMTNFTNSSLGYPGQPAGHGIHGDQQVGYATHYGDQQMGYGLRSELPSNTSIVSEKSTKHHPHKLFPNQPDKLSEALGYMSHDLAKSPLTTSPNITRQVGTLSIKSKYSKNKDIIHLPQMKESDRHHSKATSKHSTVVAQPAGIQAFSGISLASGSQSGVGAATGGRGIILANIPQITSLESLKAGSGIRPPPTPPSTVTQHTNDRPHPEATSFHYV